MKLKFKTIDIPQPWVIDLCSTQPYNIFFMTKEATTVADVIEIDLTDEADTLLDYIDWRPHTRFIADGKTDIRAQVFSEEASELASEIMDLNNLDVALALRSVENSFLHSFIAEKLLKYKIYELSSFINAESAERLVMIAPYLIREELKKRALSKKPFYEQALLGFQNNREEMLGENYPDGVSRHRIHSVELAVNDLFIKVGINTNSDNPFGKSPKIKPEILAPWIATWQPRVWEELPNV